MVSLTRMIGTGLAASGQFNFFIEAIIEIKDNFFVKNLHDLV